MHWNYRALLTPEGVGVFAVYYDDSGRIVGHDEKPYVALEGSLEELLERLRLIVEELEKHGNVS